MNLSITKFIKYAQYPVYILIAVAVIILAILIYRGVSARKKADIRTWHQFPKWIDNLTQKEYHNFKAYLAAENKFLDDIYQSAAVKETVSYNRYAKDNLSSPYVAGKNLNASFEFSPSSEKEIQGGILLVHGLTDSPYHLRSIGHLFADNGYYVIGLRLPGHGTVPGALLNVTWEDWYAAVQFGARMVQDKIENLKNSKFYVGGFSTGGALTLRYAMDTLIAQDTQDMRIPDKLLLLAPAIGVNRLTQFMDWHHIISWISCFEKFKWLEIKPEYDPFKYNSFAKNAADQVFDLTNANWKLIKEISDDDSLCTNVPPIYAFQSRVDATVKTNKLLEMFAKIASDKSELLIFDVNRQLEPAMDEKLKTDVIKPEFMEKIGAQVLLVTNMVKSKVDGYDSRIFIKALNNSGEKSYLLNQIEEDSLKWPANLFALSHVCIPISPDDAYYGRDSILGGINMKGEREVFLLENDLSRLRYNPFFCLLKKQLEVVFLGSENLMERN